MSFSPAAEVESSFIIYLKKLWKQCRCPLDVSIERLYATIASTGCPAYQAATEKLLDRVLSAGAKPPD